jgi:purine-binding chemotaxis protein CheW
MTETAKNPVDQLDVLIGKIDQAINAAADPQAAKLGSALFAGLRQAEQGRSYILVSIGTARLAILLEDVVEVGDLPMLTRLPNVPPWLRGIVNVRGEIVSVVDLPRFLEWRVDSTAQRKRMVIIQQRSVKTALSIDAVLGMHRRTDQTEMITGSPPLLGQDGSLLPSALVLDGQPYYLLDCQALFTSKRFVDVRHL